VKQAHKGERQHKVFQKHRALQTRASAREERRYEVWEEGVCKTRAGKFRVFGRKVRSLNKTRYYPYVKGQITAVVFDGVNLTRSLKHDLMKEKPQQNRKDGIETQINDDAVIDSAPSHQRYRLGLSVQPRSEPLRREYDDWKKHRDGGESETERTETENRGKNEPDRPEPRKTYASASTNPHRPWCVFLIGIGNLCTGQDRGKGDHERNIRIHLNAA